MKKITLLLIATIMVLATGNLSAQAPIAHFKFDGNLNDFRGNFTIDTDQDNHPETFTYVTGRDLTPNGAVTGIGIDEYFETIENVNITGNANRTVLAWIKTSATKNNGGSGVTQRGIVNIGHNANFRRFSLLLISGEVRNDITAGGGTTDGLTITDNAWHQLAVVFDKDAGTSPHGTSTIYVDGEDELVFDWKEDPPAARTLNTSARPLVIGNDIFDLADRGFEGAIDDVEIYDVALSKTQIQTLYSAGTLSNKKASSTSVKVYPNPVQDQLVIDNYDVTIVEIYDIVGRKLSTNTVINRKLSLGNLSKGVYMLICKDAQNKYIATIEVIKD